MPTSNTRCEELRRADFSALQDAPMQIIRTAVVASSGNKPGYCEVEGYVSPSFGFLLRLPPAEHWNGKFLESGCASACGPLLMRNLMFRCDDPLRRGYACIMSDGGHQSKGDDGLWLYNNPQAVVDYAARAPHLTALAGKAVVTKYYAKPPMKSYFTGCSAGGLQALWEAQRFPWDFDGIIAGSPSMRHSETVIGAWWYRHVFTAPDGKPLLLQADIDLLHRAVVDQCDMNDGIKDGLIGDPRACIFDPSKLRCKAAPKGTCLTDLQVAAVERIYDGPTTSTGEKITLPLVMKGSELNWIRSFSPESRESNNMLAYFADWLRYYFIQPNPGPSWKLENLDFERDYKRMGLAQIAEPLNPDLRRMRDTGSKLILYTGWNDECCGVLAAVDYYEVAEKLHGGRTTTQDFMRLFAIPGADHCHEMGLDGSFTAVDYLTYMENWVEKGQAPDTVIAQHVTSGTFAESIATTFPIDPVRVDYERPIYPYPIQTKYLGHGDPKDATSFGPSP